MIIKGTQEELELNRQGRLAPAQRERLSKMAVFNMPALPILLLAPIFAAIGAMRGGTWLWLGLVVAGCMLWSGLSRLRQQRALSAGLVQQVAGTLQQQRPVPIRYLEALLTIAGQQLILPRDLPGGTLQQGRSYRVYTIRGVASRPVVVAVETDEATGDRRQASGEAHQVPLTPDA